MTTAKTSSGGGVLTAGPHVNRLSIWVFPQHLGRQVPWCPSKPLTARQRLMRTLVGTLVTYVSFKNQQTLQSHQKLLLDQNQRVNQIQTEAEAVGIEQLLLCCHGSRET